MSTLASSRRNFVVTTVVAAATAALAAAGSLALSLPVWAMFIGWIAFFTRVQGTRTAFENLGCVGIGMIMGLLAAISIPQLAAFIGPSLGLPIVVFVVALVVVALRGLPVLNNLLGYFLGLVAWFAAHLDPSLEALVQLFGASAVGSVAGWVSHNLPAPHPAAGMSNMGNGKLLGGRRSSRAVRPLLGVLICGTALLTGGWAVSGEAPSNSTRESQTMATIPQPILAFFESSNRGDAAGVVACFTPTAVLDDWGRHFEGHEGVASWDRTDNTGVQAQIEPVSATAQGDTLVVTVKVSGNGFNGTGHMHFQLDGDKIARLDIK